VNRPGCDDDCRIAASDPPELDDELRARLRRRYGSALDAWLADVPAVLAELAVRWRLEWDAIVQRGSMSVVVRCRTADGEAAVLKLTPDRARVAREGAALAAWRTPHVPRVLGVDERAGALLLEAVEPGTPLAETATYPAGGRLASLLGSLHATAGPHRAHPPVAERIAYLFDASTVLYERKPDLVDLVPPQRYEAGRRRALQLAAEPGAAVLLHGDLTAVNVLDGGPARGLVAIDPAPCVGDPAFDAVDLVLWRAEDADTIAARAAELAPAAGGDTARVLDWCGAFAAMIALELAEAGTGSPRQIGVLAELASA
jgi:streptomycin 6-kinase